MPPDSSRRNKYFFVAALAAAAAFVASLLTGKYPLSPADVASILSGTQTDAIKTSVFFGLRLPRTLTALLAGAGLGMTGAVFQTVFKNPLAAPDIIGVSSGANLGAALAIVAFGYNTPILAASAFSFAFIVVLFVVALARVSGRVNTVAYIMAGIVMKAVSESLIMLLKYFADPEKELAAMEYWSMGSFAAITAQKLFAVFPIFLFGFAGLVLMRRHIALLALEDDESRTLGERVGPVRALVLAFAALTTASIICVSGLVTFVGLIAPHIARLVLKRVSFAQCVLASIIGAFVLLTADCAARSLSPGEIPVSILTTLVGVPCLVVFMRARRLGKV